MRAQKPQSTAPKPMIAYADPIFSKTARKEAQKVALAKHDQFLFRNSNRHPSSCGNLRPATEKTKDEVLKVAKTLNAPENDIHTGLAATETAVKQAALDQYRIVYFATHALVTGDLKAIAKAKAEPALALTIPDNKPIWTMGCYEHLRSRN